MAIELAVAGFAAVWEGREVEPTTLVAAPAAVVTDAIEKLVARGRCEVDDHGRLVGIHGLTLRSTRHSFVHDRRVRHTWCAFDSIGIPAALGIDGSPTPTAGVAISASKSGSAPAAPTAPVNRCSGYPHRPVTTS